MPVIARDAVAGDHLVYAWPFPIGPEEYEVSCSDEELVVMCPAWMVGDRLGPGRHRWRSPDPMRPASAFFVLTSPVEVSFDCFTQFLMPMTGQPVRLRAVGSLQVRCADPALLIAQFVGLPFDHVNEGIVRSVSRSIERMLARLLTRRVVMAGTPLAATDPTQQAGIIEELVAYNPAAGAVFGIELMRMGHLGIYADDGSQPLQQLNGHSHRAAQVDTERAPQPSLVDTARGRPASNPPPQNKRAQTNPPTEVSGEIGGTVPPHKRATTPPPIPGQLAKGSVPPAAPRKAGSVEVPQTDEITQPGVDIIRTPLPGAMKVAEPPPTSPQEPRGSILGIGMSHIGSGGVASGEIPQKVSPGARVLVPGPNGLMMSATVRQLLQGYYELEVGGSGETIWVPVTGVVPE
ncbi:MAG: hypothetical protein JO257_13320 [Deltaproteobacteria bacterium]|nr:hypothetical protein [Deltaproteobacteria bacterium]